MNATRFVTSIGASLCAVLLSGVALAATWTEAGSAGRLPATAQNTTGAGALDEIVGNLLALTEVDMYLIRIGAPAIFSASTEDSPLNVPDPQLFLFNAAGLG